MKKTISLVLLLAASSIANAELVLKGNKLRVCPGVLTSSGKSVVFTVDNGDDGEVTIYSPDFLVDKTFKLPALEYQGGSFEEEATVTPTGLEVVPETYYDKNYYIYDQYIDASSQEEMISRLTQYYDSEDDIFIAFTDAMGNPACYSKYADFMYENIFGKQYPRKWYALIDGSVYEIYTRSGFYVITYDEESAVWTRTSEDIYTINPNLDDVRMYFEGTHDDYSHIYVSQTLFNSDDKWEYIVYDETGPSSIYYSSPEVEINDDGTVTLRRTGWIEHESRGYAVYNEDGEKLGNIPYDVVCVINGKTYVYIDYDRTDGDAGLYSLDTDSGDIDLVEVLHVKSERMLDARRGIVTVDISAEKAGGEVVVSTTDGKVLANKRVGEGQTQINEQPLPAGIYIVSLLKDGKVVESEKYLVQ